MDTGNLDKELLAEMLSAMGKELKLARARIKEAEDEAKVSYIIDCLVAYSWLMREVE